MAAIQRVYTAEPTLALFHQERYFFKHIEGPFGSGKSSGCIMDIVMRAFRQQPDDKGIRKSRWAIIRQTYPELKATTVKTFQHWVPEEVAPVVQSIPMVSKFYQPLQDGTTVQLEFVFLALEGPDDVKKLLSFELTGAYLNEAREISWEIIEALTGRVPRYPQTIKNEAGETIYGPTEPGIISDSNPPRTGHWLYEKFETGNVPKGWKKYTQPPAVFRNIETGAWELNPDAENLSHLPDNYYQNQLEAGSEEFIRVNLGGEFGMSRKGKPVFAKYNDTTHASKEILQPIRGFPIIMGIDFGLTPAAVFAQVTGQGLRVLDELPATDEMLEDYIAQYILPLVAKRYQGFSLVACGDPAGRNRDRLSKRSDFDLLRTNNIRAYPAETNDPIRRIEAVNWFMVREKGFLISAQCTHLREALAGGYVFKEQRNNSGQVTDIPDKNEYSHIADALQYASLFARFGSRHIQGKPLNTTKKPFLYA